MAEKDRPETGVTRKRVTSPGRSRIIGRLLDDDPSRAWTARELAHRTDGKRGATRTALSRMKKAGMVRHLAPYLWQSVRSFVRPGLPDPRLRLHGLKVEARNKGVGWSCRQVFQRVSMVWASPTQHRHPLNGSITGSSEWEGRHVTWTVHKEEVGLVEVFLQASSQPLTLVEAFAFLTATLQAATGIPTNFWKIVQADWNVDLPGSVATDLGITGLSVAGFGRYVLKVYEKVAREMTRVEVRSFEPLTADAVTAYIRSILTTLDEARLLDQSPNGEAV